MKIIVSYYSNEPVTAQIVKAKLQDLGLNPKSVRKRKVQHVHFQWWVQLSDVLLGTGDGVDEARAKAYPDLHCINFITIHDQTCPHPNTYKYFHLCNNNRAWDKQLTPII